MDAVLKFKRRASAAMPAVPPVLKVDKKCLRKMAAPAAVSIPASVPIPYLRRFTASNRIAALLEAAYIGGDIKPLGTELIAR